MYPTEEIGDSGTPHLQGAITFRKAMRGSTVKALCDKIHWGVMLCNARDGKAFQYCRKDGKMVIDYKDPKQGKRNDLGEVRTRR